MIAIIPARGGSKGLPKKNSKLLLGKPLIAYTIEAALQAKHISRVIISTDCETIAAISKEFGAEVPFLRPSYLAEDNSKAIDAYKHAIHFIEDKEKLTIENFVVLQPTSPLRNSDHIDEAIELFRAKNAHSVISFTKENHSIFWHKYVDTTTNKLEPIFKGDFNKNRQEIKSTYYPNGSIFVFSKAVLVTGDYYNDNTYAYLMPIESSVDIDTAFDFKLAAFLLQNKA